MKTNGRKTGRPEHRHIRIQLPPMDPDLAVALVRVLDKAIEAVWRTYGDAMADYLGCVAPDSMPRPPDAVWSSSGSDTEDDLIF